MNAQQLDAITNGHQMIVEHFVKARVALEESSRLTVAASVAVEHPTVRWVIMQDSDQGDGLWIESAILDDSSEVDLTDWAGDEWAWSAASDIYDRDDLVDLHYGGYALEVWPEIDRWEADRLVAPIP